MSYANIAQLQARYDQRTLAQVSNDVNGQAGVTANLQACLDDATADIALAALQGSIYTPAQLQALADNSDPAMVRLCCSLAAGNALKRRMDQMSPAVTADLDRANKMLDAIRQGMLVFNVPANRVADIPQLVTISSTEAVNLQDWTATQFFDGPYGTRTILGPN